MLTWLPARLGMKPWPPAASVSWGTLGPALGSGNLTQGSAMKGLGKAWGHGETRLEAARTGRDGEIGGEKSLLRASTPPAKSTSQGQL